jgi:hypothetical protein
MVKVSDIALVDPYPWTLRKGENKRQDNRPVLGWDTETCNGKVSLIANGLKEHYIVRSFKDILNFWFRDTNNMENPAMFSLNFFYNLEYDQNAVIKHLPDRKLLEIIKKDGCTYLGADIHVIKGKCLKIKYHDRTVKFFDISPFYMGDKDDLCGLERTYNRVFGEGKFRKSMSAARDFPADEITEADVDYCIADAKACQDLAQHFISVSRQFFNVKNYYSPASLGKALMRKNLWAEGYRFRPSMVQDAALRSFGGARIECLVRGHIDKAYFMDISSAYPWAMTELIDDSGIQVSKAEYLPESKHSFFRVDVDIPEEWHIGPLRLLLKNQVIYPVGTLKDVPITKVEYELLAEYGLKMRINKGFHILGESSFKPFAYMKDVYNERMRLKALDDIRQIPLKLALNASYGALIETRKVVVKADSKVDSQETDLIPQNREFIAECSRFRAGAFFNPIFASEVTASIRCRMFKDSFMASEDVIFYATDCICASKPFDLDFMSKDAPVLGYYELGERGSGYVNGSGVYTFELENGKLKAGGRGFGRSLDIRPYMHQNTDRIRFERRGPRKLKESRNDLRNFNIFRKSNEEYKMLNLNFDRKRIWNDIPYSFKEISDCCIGSEPIRILEHYA